MLIVTIFSYLHNVFRFDCFIFEVVKKKKKMTLELFILHHPIWGSSNIFFKEKILKTFMGKEENVGNQHFLLFPQCFPFFKTQTSLFCFLLVFSQHTVIGSDKTKIFSPAPGLTKRIIMKHNPLSRLTE